MYLVSGTAYIKTSCLPMSYVESLITKQGAKVTNAKQKHTMIDLAHNNNNNDNNKDNNDDDDDDAKNSKK